MLCYVWWVHLCPMNGPPAYIRETGCVSWHGRLVGCAASASSGVRHACSGKGRQRAGGAGFEGRCHPDELLAARGRVADGRA